MIIKSVIVFAVLDDGSIHQVLLSEEEKGLIKNTLYLIAHDSVKCSDIDFSSVLKLRKAKENDMD